MGMTDGVLKPVFEQAPVGNAGKRIVVGQLADLFLVPVVLGDVCEQSGVMGGLAVIVGYCRNSEQFQVQFSGFASVPDFAASFRLLPRENNR